MFPRPVSVWGKIAGRRGLGLPALAAASAALALGAGGAAAATGGPVPDDREAAPSSGPAGSLNSRVIVQWRDGADRAERVAARADAGVTYAAELGDPSFQLVETEGGGADAAAAALEADPAVAVAEPDGFRRLEAIPNDPFFAQQWGLRNTGQSVAGLAGGRSGNDIDVVNAWDRTVGTPSTVVADIDSGYRFDSPDLGPVVWTNPDEIPGNGIDDDGNGYVDDVHGWDFVGPNSTANPLPEDNDPTDDNLISGGHGVHTAGIIGAAGNNGIGISGVARNVRIMPLRVCANEPSTNEVRCPFSSIIAAINYAGNNGARVANLSLGGTIYSQLEVNAYAEHPETLYVIAAGNEAADNDSGGSGTSGHHYPCDYRPGAESSPLVSGAIENTICVAALDPSEALASYSDYGTTSVDLGAPGTAILSTFPASKTLFSDNFESNDFTTRWSPLGIAFGRTDEAPLTSFGIADTPGATPEANHIYGVELTEGIAVPAGTGACQIEGRRFRTGGGQFGAPYGLNIDGSHKEFDGGETSGSEMLPFHTVPILNLGGHTVKPFFEYHATATPTAAEGAWLDDIALTCNAPLSTQPSYAFEQGTSMATPQVTGAAALLFSLKPTATVTEVREALLTTAAPTASLAGKTVTGGRLDVNAALNKLVPAGTETTAPDTEIQTSTPTVTAATTAKFHARRLDADRGTFECSFSAIGAFKACGDEIEALGLAFGEHTLRVRAKNAAGIADPTPASFTWTVRESFTVIGEETVTPAPIPVAPPTSEPDQPSAPSGPTTTQPKPLTSPAGCTVPKLAGKSLGVARAALSAAGCKLGKVISPKVPRGTKPPKLVVKTSTPAAGSRTTGAIGIKLAAKPKRHPH
jgi:subtilisin family serine protease